MLEGILFLFVAAAILKVVLKFVHDKPSRKQKEIQRIIRSHKPSPSSERTHTRHVTPHEAFDEHTAETSADIRAIKGRAYIIDGDSLVINKTQIRLFGVDAPEINHPYGQKAKWAMVSLCKGQTIRAEILQEDAHGRTVAKCFLEDGRDLSDEMVKLGMAIDWPKFSGGIYRSLELPDGRRKLWLADARQKGRVHVWEAFEARQSKSK